MFFRQSGDDLELRKPKSVFARVDRIEEADGENDTVLLDCLDTRWFEEEGSDAPPLADRNYGEGRNPDTALSILTIDALEMKKRYADLAEGQWYCLDLGPPAQADLIADQYMSLFSDPNPRGVINITPVDVATKDRLNYLSGWGNAMPSPKTDISKALKTQRRPDAVAIYDVGQGAATALLSDGAPVLYFDFGGSTIGNWRSFPSHLKTFCFTHEPPIVLSHWDWDHWSSAIRDQNAFGMTWVLPLQKSSGALGPVHARFLAMLKQRSKILWWEPSISEIKVKGTSARIIQSNGPAHNRNESGLALIVEKTGKRSRSVLLPGDASFAHLKTKAKSRFDHSMVPHHGGKTGLTSLPVAMTKSRSHAIYSYGVGNIFLHPRADTVTSYRQHWKKNTHTALRNETGFGHIGIDLTGRRHMSPFLPCSGNCQLAIQQWL